MNGYLKVSENIKNVSFTQNSALKYAFLGWNHGFCFHVFKSFLTSANFQPGCKNLESVILKNDFLLFGAQLESVFSKVNFPDFGRQVESGLEKFESLDFVGQLKSVLKRKKKVCTFRPPIKSEILKVQSLDSVSEFKVWLVQQTFANSNFYPSN